MGLYEREGKIWFRESLFPDVAQEFLVSEVLAEKRTKFQKLLILKTPRFGKILVLDDVVQLTEEDEHFYHEAMAHCPLFLCADPQNVLVIGGGDGGIIREVVKHPSVNKIDLVEIDEEVITFSKTHLSEVSAGAFNDLRVNVVIDDGAEFVRRKKNQYDVIIIDSTDPFGPAEVLFRTNFYRDVYSVLKKDGIVIRQTGSSILQPSECPSNYRQMREIFDNVEIVQIPVATYIGGDFTLVMGFKGKKIDFPLAKNILERKFKKAQLKTKWYSPKKHEAATVLSPELEERIQREKYGEELIMDLYGCDYETVASTEKVAEWAKRTCGVINMIPFGEPFAPDFGHGKAKTAGPSVVQFIETSAIEAHYSPHWLLACANIFTCAELPVKDAIGFTMDYFKAKRARIIFMPRGSFEEMEEFRKKIKIFEVNSKEELEEL